MFLELTLKVVIYLLVDALSFSIPHAEKSTCLIQTDWSSFQTSSSFLEDRFWDRADSFWFIITHYFKAVGCQALNVNVFSISDVNHHFSDRLKVDYWNRVIFMEDHLNFLMSYSIEFLDRKKSTACKIDRVINGLLTLQVDVLIDGLLWKYLSGKVDQNKH